MDTKGEAMNQLIMNFCPLFVPSFSMLMFCVEPLLHPHVASDCVVAALSVPVSKSVVRRNRDPGFVRIDGRGGFIV
jgi:hypothetical protein